MKTIWQALHADLRIWGEFPTKEMRDEHIAGWPGHIREKFDTRDDVRMPDDYEIQFPRQMMKALTAKVEAWKAAQAGPVRMPGANKPLGMPMYEHMRERFELAYTYAEDGAYRRAATILSDLAADVQRHAMALTEYEQQMMKGSD